MDLATREHWEKVYDVCSGSETADWEPSCHEDLALEYLLADAIRRHRPRGILEIGCGNSPWLPYLAKKYSLEVSGLDYAENGCRLARERLLRAGVGGTVYCADLFKVDAGEIGTYDLVYSLGVVEHFADTETVLSRMLEFVRPGGVLLAEIPNLRSIHGLLMWAYQPEILAKHVPLSRRAMEKAFGNLSLGRISSGYAGLFSLGIVSWGFSPRFARLDRIVLPVMKILRTALHFALRRVRLYHGLAPFSPFLHISGVKE